MLTGYKIRALNWIESRHPNVIHYNAFTVAGCYGIYNERIYSGKFDEIWIITGPELAALGTSPDLEEAKRIAEEYHMERVMSLLMSMEELQKLNEALPDFNDG